MKSFDRLVSIIEALRSPDGCPWDREQTPLSMAPALIEEAYELIEAIDEHDDQHIAEEVGDLILVVTMIAYMHQQENKFSIADSLNSISDKLIRRHPHVFGDVDVKDSEEVLKNWDTIKETVEGRKRKYLLDGIPTSFPPLVRAMQMQKKAAKKGFDWKSENPVFVKVNEELEELRTEIKIQHQTKKPNPNISRECGDLLFSVVNLCRKLGVDPSIALDQTNRKFKSRFDFIEQQFNIEGLELIDKNVNQMEYYWNLSKK